MKRDFKPYTSVTVSSLKDGGNFLNKILSSNYDFQPRKIDKPVILYGAGNLGKMAKSFFNYLNIPFLYVVDKNASKYKYKTDEFWGKTRIIHPDDVKEKEKKNCLLIVCVVTTPLIVLRNELKNNGWEDVAFFYDVSQSYCAQYPLNNGWCLDKLNENDKKLIKKVFLSLIDDVSRAYYLQFLAWRKLRVELLFDGLEINNNNRFFIPEIINVLRKNEVFVDCGAHKGSVTKKFIQIVNNKYEAIYAIEPDCDNFEILEIQLKDFFNVKTIKCALSEKNGEEKFYQGFDFASKLCKNGSVLVKTTPLDDLNIKATFIKMHLEGGELNALKGAVNTIRKCRPIIAVTIYHNSEGVWEIPFFLISNIKNYKYYLRLHSWGGTGAVFYALPEERIIK